MLVDQQKMLKIVMHPQTSQNKLGKMDREMAGKSDRQRYQEASPKVLKVPDIQKKSVERITPSSTPSYQYPQIKTLDKKTDSWGCDLVCPVWMTIRQYLCLLLVILHLGINCWTSRFFQRGLFVDANKLETNVDASASPTVVQTGNRTLRLTLPFLAGSL